MEKLHKSVEISARATASLIAEPGEGQAWLSLSAAGTNVTLFVSPQGALALAALLTEAAEVAKETVNHQPETAAT